MENVNKLRIIRFNDDNHAESVWGNGRYLGNLSDIDTLLLNFMGLCNKGNFECMISTSVWTCDDFDDMNEDVVDTVWDWFNTVTQMTAEQVYLVFEKDWEKLMKTI